VQLFIELMLRKDQIEYEEEGIHWEPVPYHNNKAICDLIEENNGLIVMMDDECVRRKQPDDKTLMSVFDAALKGCDYYDSRAKRNDFKFPEMTFRITHYAGQVTYAIAGFTDKNMDSFYRDCAQLMFESSNGVAKVLFSDGA
jgi:myosin I